MKIISFLVVVCFFCASCRWFAPKPNPLIGQWKIDSLHINQEANAIGYLLLAMSMQNDSSGPDITFTKDSLVFFSKSGADKTAYHLNAENELILQDETNEHFQVQLLNDSLLSLCSKDSTMLFLKRI